jgi:actin-related protein
MGCRSIKGSLYEYGTNQLVTCDDLARAIMSHITSLYQHHRDDLPATMLQHGLYMRASDEENKTSPSPSSTLVDTLAHSLHTFFRLSAITPSTAGAWIHSVPSSRVWLGGSMLTSMSIGPFWITQDEYISSGATIIRRRLFDDITEYVNMTTSSPSSSSASMIK